MPNEPPAQPAPTRLAATLLLVRDDPFQVLMVRRHKEMHFASALVFPGGTVDKTDHDPAWASVCLGITGLSEPERILRIAACRETFEETAILLGHDARGVYPGPITDNGDFLGIIHQHHLLLTLGKLQLFGHWITPVHAPKRFDTYFFIAHAPNGAQAVCNDRESSDLLWMSPGEALTYTIPGERPILFPTKMNLLKLARSRNAAEAIAQAARDPVVTVMPEVERFADYHVVHIPAEAGYGITEERIPAPRGAPGAN